MGHLADKTNLPALVVEKETTVWLHETQTNGGRTKDSQASAQKGKKAIVWGLSERMREAVSMFERYGSYWFFFLLKPLLPKQWRKSTKTKIIPLLVRHLPTERIYLIQ